jgi:uncharacterized membrane protein YhaH (DUF805 family)/uncharacterized membrane protein YiaA
MGLRFLDLWHWDGTASRRTYATVGVSAFAIKSVVDRMLGAKMLGYPRGLFLSYWAPLGRAIRFRDIPGPESEYLLLLLVWAMPFIWIGVAMSVKRLRDAGQPLWLVILFFIPLINLLFFLALCFLPSGERKATEAAAPWPAVRPLDEVIPRSQLGSALLSIALTSCIGFFFIVLGTTFMGSYGWSLFVALPFCLGLFAVLLHSYHGPRDYGTCMSVALLPVGLVGLALLVVALEGVICILMAAPLALGLAWLGGSLGYYIQGNYWGAKHGPALLSIVLFAMPGVLGVERAASLKPPTFVVRTSIEVDARPEKVWRQVVAFSEIPPPTEMLFRAGIAYPIRAEITGYGAGAMRRCVFSTGAFLEPIEVWDEPRLLKFGVTASPAPLNELTPYSHIEPRHLHGYFVSEDGQFLLTALPGGKTRLEGTTHYRNAMWPAAYWHIWSDYIIHRIHLRVLNHIKEAAEHSRAGN